MQTPTDSKIRPHLARQLTTRSMLLKIETVLTSYKNLPDFVPAGEIVEAQAARLAGCQAQISFVFAITLGLALLLPQASMAAALQPALEHHLPYRPDTQMTSHPEKRIVVAPVYQTDVRPAQPAINNL